MQVKALCGGDLLYDKVSKALMRMFGADHKPNPEDLMNAGRVNVLGNNMTFCGAEVGQSLDFTTVSISLADYVKQVKPISIDKHRKTMVDDVCNDVEKKQLRAIVEAMAWPGDQCLPQIAATCSLLQAAVSSPTVSDLLEANGGLRFLKEVGRGFKLNIDKHYCSLRDLRFGVYADAA